MKDKKVALIWPTFDFYHVARFRDLFGKLNNKLLGIELFGGRINEDVGRWRYIERQGLAIKTLIQDPGSRLVNRFELGKLIVDKLREFEADVIFVNGYSTPEFRMVINWALQNGRKCFTFFETKENDCRRFFIKEWFKSRIIRKLDGAICGGALHKEYLIKLGMEQKRIFMGYDVVDNDFFSEGSNSARKESIELREKYGLPEKYFLSVSRFVKKKNILGLIRAYELYRKMDPNPWGLVICGAGPQEKKLREMVSEDKIKGVSFAGPKNPDELTIYYGLSSCFILPSLVEQWGLVVNEAMACSLPVLASEVAGSSFELVEEGVNGYKFNPLNIKQLCGCMLRISQLESVKLVDMGKASRSKIQPYSLNYFSENMLKAILSVED